MRRLAVLVLLVTGSGCAALGAVDDGTSLSSGVAEGVIATRATLDLAQRAYDIATVRFRSGLSTQLELDESEQDLIEAQVNAAEALYLHMLARAILLHAMGEI